MSAAPDLIARGLGATDDQLGLGQPPVYRVFVRDNEYNRVGELTDYLSVSFVDRVNNVGTWSLEISRDSPEAALVTKTAGVIITRDDVTIFSGPVGTEWTRTSRTIRAAGYSDSVLLLTPARPTPSQATAPFTDEFDERTGVASTIMRQLVDVNIGPSAPSAWKIAALTLATDPVLGTSITSRARLDPLITLLGELALTPYAGGLRFWILQSDTVENAVTFHVAAPADKSEDVKFSVELGTAQDFEDTWQAPEANYFYVAADDGLGNDRTIVEGGDADSIAELGRKIARYIPASGVTDTGELNQRLAEALAGAVSSRRVTITPVETPSLEYGRDWDLGDLVTFVTDGEEFAELIREVQVELTSDRGAIVTPMIGQAGTSGDDSLSILTLTIANRLDSWQRLWSVPPNSVLPSMMRTIDAPADEEIYVYDSATGTGEWQSLAELAVGVAFSSLASVSASGSVTGSQIVSTVSTGTAPLVVNSTTKVTNLNADKLDGLDSSDFVEITGDTMTGVLQIRPANDVALKLQHTSGDGIVSLGATSSATPAMILKNNAATQIGRFANSGLFLAGDMTSAVGTAGNGDVQVNDVWLTDGNNVRRISINTTSLQISNNATGGGTPSGTDVTISDVGTMTIPKIVVDSDADIDGTLTVGTGIDVTGGGITIASGGISVDGSSGFRDQVTFGVDLGSLDTAIHLTNNSVIDFDYGSASSATITGWDGYVYAKHDGATIKLYYKS